MLTIRQSVASVEPGHEYSSSTITGLKEHSAEWQPDYGAQTLVVIPAAVELVGPV